MHGQVDLGLALKLLKYARYLRRATSSAFFDYSAVQAISRWIAGALYECSPIFLHLASHARALEDAVSLSSGLGLTEIWSSFLVHRSLDLPAVELIRFDTEAGNLRDCVDTYGIVD
jgi:midasin